MTGLVTIDNPSMEAAPATVGICQRDIDAVRKQMFIDFCSALEREGIPYAILAGHRDYPEKIASDVDFMVSEADFKRLPALLNSPSTVRGSQIVQILEHESSARYYVLVKQLGHRLAYLHPDAASNYRLDARLWMHSDAVLASRRKSPSGFWIPAPAAEFEYYFVKRIEKECIETRHLDQLSGLLAEDHVGCQTVLAKLFPANAAAISKAINCHDIIWFETQSSSLKKILSKSIHRETMMQRLRGFYNEYRRLARRILQPTGFIIAVLGPDGSGKTTVIEHLEKELAPAFRQMRRFHLRPHFGTTSAGAIETDPHGKLPRGHIVSALKIGFFVVDYWLGWIRLVLPAKVRSSLIVFDRHFHDMLVDTKRYRLPGTFVLSHWLAPFIPQPDLWLILTADPKLLVDRKGEITLDDAQKLVAAYKQLAAELPSAVVIDTSYPLERTLTEALTAVRERLEARAQCHLKYLL